MREDVRKLKEEMDNIHYEMKDLDNRYVKKGEELKIIQQSCPHKESIVLDSSVIVCKECNKFLGHKV